jgi:hypothetical protein
MLSAPPSAVTRVTPPVTLCRRTVRRRRAHICKTYRCGRWALIGRVRGTIGVSGGREARQIAGRFILSVNDVPETREFFRRFAIETVATRYTVSRKWSDVTEIVVTGPSAERLPTSRDLLSFSEGSQVARRSV